MLVSASLPLVSHSITRRSGFGNGSGSSSRARTTLKIAVLAPIPSASVMIATAVNPGRAVNTRNA